MLARNGGNIEAPSSTFPMRELSISFPCAFGRELEKNGISICSFGLSYAFGIAGTGGTSSSYLSVEECTLRCFGVGSLDVEPLMLIRLAKLPFDPLRDWKELLVLRLTPPDCRCLVLASGLALADEGVIELFRGIRLGLGCVNLEGGTSCWTGTSGCGVGGVLGLGTLFGIGGACIMLILFNLLVSVGEMVLAPRPDIRPFAVDCLLLPDEFGVFALLLVGRPVFAERCIGVFGSGSRGGGCMLFVLFALGLMVDRRGRDASAEAGGLMVMRRLALDMLLVLARLGCEADTGIEAVCVWLGRLPSFIIVVIRPGPTLFLGGRAAALDAMVAAAAAGAVD